MTALGRLSDVEKGRIEQCIRWHAEAARASNTTGYLSVGVENVIRMVERILAEHVGEAELIAKGWADEAVGLHAQLSDMPTELPGMWEPADFEGGATDV